MVSFSDNTTESWLTSQSESVVRELARELLNDATARGRWLRRIQVESGVPAWPLAETSRTVADVRNAARELLRVRREERQKAAAILKEKQRQAAEQARQEFLQRIKDDPTALMRRIDACVALRNRKN